jgi:CDP-diglyceride synthetase
LARATLRRSWAEIVGFCFCVGFYPAIVVLRFIGRFSPGSLWPWVGIVLLFSLYVYTPGRGEFRGHGGWADFEKLHESLTRRW